MASEVLMNYYIGLNLIFYWLIFILCYGESLVVVGFFIPGSITLILSGYLSAKGYFDFGDLFVFSSLGAVAGDYTSYYLGSVDAFDIKSGKRGKGLGKRIESGKKFFLKYGSFSVFLGRFIGVLRPIIPFVAGIFKMDKRKFFFLNILSGLAWSFSHLIVGYFFYHSYVQLSEWISNYLLFFHQ